MWKHPSGNSKLLFVILSVMISSLILLISNAAYSQNEDVSYLDVNSTASAQLSKFSVAAWFKTSTDYTSNAFIVNKAGASDNMNYGIWMTSTETIRGGFETPSGSAYYATSPLSYSDGNWHYAVVTFDGSAIILYLDGLPVATKSASATPDSGGDEPIRMGADSQTLNNYFVGNVDEVRIWKNALTAQQVADAFNGNFNPKGLVEYLDFSEPIVPVNATAPVNTTAPLIATATNQTGLPATNGTLNNGTGLIHAPIADNETNTNDTGGNLPPIEIPQISNETSSSNDTGIGDQQTPPERVNNPPTATGQSVSLDQDKQIDITLQASDADNDKLQFDIAADPSQGSLTNFDKEQGTITYVPKKGYFGDDKFSFKVTDENGSESNGADVNVQVNEVTPPSQSNQNEQNNAVENNDNTLQVEDNTNTNANANTNANKNANTNANTNTQVIEQPNLAPSADAGKDQKAEVNTEVKLDAGDSKDQDGQIVSYKWEQTDGPEVKLKDSDKKVAVFDVPDSAADSNLVFKLTVTDDKEDTGDDDVTVKVEQVAQDDSDSEGGSN
jgi:Concanavalin A-like lectin/glucanases superfamily/K319L-like, PKD domain/Bacterial Ig domain